MSIAVERRYLSMRVHLLSVAKGSTRAREMNGLCGCKVCIPCIKHANRADNFPTNRYP